jgi:hypothetical protein
MIGHRALIIDPNSRGTGNFEAFCRPVATGGGDPAK